MCYAELRSLFQTKLLETEHEFHPLDLERADDNWYLKRVMKHCDYDTKAAADMLWDIFTWRKNVGANDINESNIRMDYVQEGAFFPHGRDVDGCILLVVKSKKHIKGTKDFEELKRIIIYWFDRIEREENGNKVTLFFDLDGCGLNNMDMDLTNYLISLFKSFYPNFLNYIIIYQMPWIMSAAFKVIKSLLPAKGVEKMKFVSKDTLKTFVLPEQALKCWGGTNDYEFEFIPENKNSENGPKKVTFAVQSNTHSPGEMLRLIPNNVIIFKKENDEVTGQFCITNMDDSAVSFKIRTTSPEKFRVRPSSGVLASGASQTIVIVVQPGFQLRNVMKDMFLVMAVHIPKMDITQKEISDIWTNSSVSKVDEYRLKCQFPVKEPPKNENPVIKRDDPEYIVRSLDNLQKEYETLQRQLSMLKHYQLLTFILSGICAIYCFLIYEGVNDNEKFSDRI